MIVLLAVSGFHLYHLAQEGQFGLLQPLPNQGGDDLLVYTLCGCQLNSSKITSVVDLASQHRGMGGLGGVTCYRCTSSIAARSVLYDQR